MSFRTTMKQSVVAALSLAALVACGGKGGEGGAAAAQAGGPLSYVPAGSNYVLVVDVQKMLSAPSVKENLAQARPMLEQDKNIKDLIATTGMDPFKDISSVVVGGSSEEKAPVIIVSGTFDAKKAADGIKAKEKNAVVEAVDAKTIIFSDDAEILAKAKEAAKGAALAGSADLKALYDAADKTKPISFAINLVGRAKGELAGTPAADAQAAFGSFEATDGINLKVSLRFPAADKANGLKTFADEQIKSSVKPVADMMGLGDLLSGLSLTIAGNDLVAEVKLSAEQLKKAQGAAAGMMGMMGGMGGSQPPMPPMPADGAAPVPGSGVPGAEVPPVPAPAPAPAPAAP